MIGAVCTAAALHRAEIYGGRAVARKKTIRKLIYGVTSNSSN